MPHQDGKFVLAFTWIDSFAKLKYRHWIANFTKLEYTYKADI
jgi:hypothetical protein